VKREARHDEKQSPEEPDLFLGALPQAATRLDNKRLIWYIPLQPSAAVMKWFAKPLLKYSREDATEGN
jgi:hypothetical protein